MRRLLLHPFILSYLFFGIGYVAACEPDCSKGARQISADILQVVCGTSQEAWSIESKAEVISSKIDVLPREAAELWSIESKAEVISSKIDGINNAPELWSIESKAEVISSKVDILVAEAGNCSLIPITGPTIIAESGSYCLANIITAVNAATPVIDVQADDVSIDFNGNVAHGFVQIQDGAKRLVMQNGAIDAADSFGTFTADYCISAQECHNLSLQSMTLRNAANTALNVATEAEELTANNCIFTGYGNYGIYISYGEACRINESLFYGREQSVTATGFAIFDGSGFNIRGSQFQFNSVGILIDDTHGGHIEGTVLVNNSIGLKLVNAQAVDVENVEATKAKHGDSPDLEVRTGDGFLVSGGHAINFEACFVSGYDIGFEMLNTTTQFTLFNCTARENQTGFHFGANVAGVLRVCTASSNKIPNASAPSKTGAGFDDELPRASSSVRYFSCLGQGNGAYPNLPSGLNGDTNFCVAGFGVSNSSFPYAQISAGTGTGLGYFNNVTI